MKKMKKANLVLFVVLALVVMFNISVISYNKGCDRERTLSYQTGYEKGINDYSEYVKEQERLKVINEAKQMSYSYR